MASSPLSHTRSKRSDHFLNLLKKMAEAPKTPANPLKLLRKPPSDMSHEERVQFLLQINEDFFQQELAQAVRVFLFSSLWILLLLQFLFSLNSNLTPSLHRVSSNWNLLHCKQLRSSRDASIGAGRRFQKKTWMQVVLVSTWLRKTTNLFKTYVLFLS